MSRYEIVVVPEEQAEADQRDEVREDAGRGYAEGLATLASLIYMLMKEGFICVRRAIGFELWKAEGQINLRIWLEKVS